MYALIENGAVKAFPYSLRDLQDDNPSVSFPGTITPEILTEFGVVPVVVIGPPAVDQRKQSVFLNGCEYNSDLARWQVVWSIRDLTAEEQEQYLSGQWELIRTQRDAFLARCDWTQLSDVPLNDEKKAGWAAYRQALRDITTQENPFAISWPPLP